MSFVPQRAIAAVGVVAIALGLAACSAPEPPAASPTPAATRPAPTPAVDVPVTAATAPPTAAAAPPIRVAVADVGVEVAVTEVGVDVNGAMELPEDPAVAGWYRFGAAPADDEGKTVISAHVDAPAYPIGPFSRLRELGAGAQVQVQDAAGVTHRYAVSSVTYYRKTELPVDDLFARGGARELVLITCGGAFDASVGRYEDNVVVIASPVG